MKRLTNRLLVSGAVALILATNLNAQNADLASLNKNDNKPSFSTSNNAPGMSSTELAASRPKLVDNFSKTFPGATNVAWTPLTEGHQVCFLISGKKTRAVYTSQDELSYSVMEYKAAELPAKLNSVLKANYSDYAVFSALEVKACQGSCYNLVLENKSGFVNLKVDGDEIEEVSKTVKSK